MDNHSFFLETNPLKFFFKAAIPGSISMLVASLYTVFDSIFVGNFLGTTAFAALSLTMPFIVINFSLADLIGVGSSVPISILLGKNKDEEANNYFTCASILIVMAGLVVGGALYFLSPVILKMMNASGELLELAVKYIRIYAIFSPFTTMIYALDNYLRISGKIKTSMFLNFLMSIGNIVFDLLFILVFKLGIIGAALGAVISMLICVFIGLSMFLKGNLQLKFVKPRFNFEMIIQIVKNGSPAFLTNVAGRIFAIIMNIALLNNGGENAIAVYGMLVTIGGIIEHILYGLLDSMQPAIGYNFGANRIDRVFLFRKYCLIGSSIISILFALVSFTFPLQMVSLFLEDSSVLTLAIHALKIYAMAYLIKWLSNASCSYLLAIERSFSAMLISLCNAFIFPSLLIFALSFLNLDGLWLNYPITAILSAILSIILIVKNRKTLLTNSIDK